MFPSHFDLSMLLIPVVRFCLIFVTFTCSKENCIQNWGLTDVVIPSIPFIFWRAVNKNLPFERGVDY